MSVTIRWPRRIDQPPCHVARLKPGGRHGLSEGFKRIVRKAGLDLQTVKGHRTRNISKRMFHALRHSLTSAPANAEVAPKLRMRLTRRTSETVHCGYSHHELAVLRWPPPSGVPVPSAPCYAREDGPFYAVSISFAGALGSVWPCHGILYL